VTPTPTKTTKTTAATTAVAGDTNADDDVHHSNGSAKRHRNSEVDGHED
jgi:hypothetical protein